MAKNPVGKTKQKVLIFGLHNSGKTVFAEQLVKRLSVETDVGWVNVDSIRSDNRVDNDLNNIIRHINETRNKIVVVDAITKSNQVRNILDCDVLIWLNRFENEDAQFEVPSKYDFVIEDWNNDYWVEYCALHILDRQEKTD